MIFLQKPNRPLAKPFLWQAGSHDILQNRATRMLPFMWQAGSYDSFAKTDNPHATLPVAGRKPRFFCKYWQPACYSLPVAGAGKHDIFAKTRQTAC
jgi:hypothetical protein